MHVDTRTLTVDLGVHLTQDEWNKLALHTRLRVHTNRGVDALVTMFNRDDYLVVPL